MRHAGALRNFASTVMELASRGHDVHLAFMMQDKLDDGRLLAQVTAHSPRITASRLGKKTPWRRWLGVARPVRTALDYLRYRAPEYADSRTLRRRAAGELTPRLRRVLDAPLLASPAAGRIVSAVLRGIDRAIPEDPWIVDLVARQQPDIMLVTPLVEIGSDQVEYLKAAKGRGVRTALCVHSWDNLTNKGLIRGNPDRVFVWNEAQKREAVSLHGIASDRVAVTGAPVYDQWFAWRPATTYGEFCGKVGLPADRPFVLYLCSSQFIASDEARFVERWIGALRSAPDACVREAGILVRPHPRTTTGQWQRLEELALPSVAIWPRGGANPVDVDAKRDYFDSMYHAAAAVGLNTSAQIEAGIVGCPVHSIRTREYAGTQEGTLHFRHLLTEGGGLLQMSDSLEAHVRALTPALGARRSSRVPLPFVEAFVRPHGIGVEATARLADAIEALGHEPQPAPARVPLSAYCTRIALYPLALATAPRQRREPKLPVVGHA